MLEDKPPLIPSHNEAWKVFNGKGMHVGYLNVNSLLSKIEELRTLAFNKNISILGITETKLDNTFSNEELKIDGYNLLQSDRKKNAVVGLLATSKTILIIIDNQEFLKTLKILF